MPAVPGVRVVFSLLLPFGVAKLESFEGRRGRPLFVVRVVAVPWRKVAYRPPIKIQE